MYDIIILGGGPGGYHMASKAANLDKKVAIIEADKFGGTCLNLGCIPSKAFIHFSNVINETNESLGEGLIGEPITADQAAIVEYKNQKVDFLVKGVEAQVKGAGAEIFNGYGKILPQENDGEFKVEVNGEVLTGKKLVIATGSSPIVPSFIKGIEEHYEKGNPDSKIITSDEIFQLKVVPEEFIVIGAGVIGIELSSHFSSLGSRVTLIDAASKVAGPADSEVSKAFKQTLTSRGMHFILESKVSEITDTEVIYTDKDGVENRIPYDKVLLAVGRKANLTGFGLENLNVEIENNFIVTNNKLKTNVKDLYAIGDVNGKIMLAHTAYREGEVAVENMIGIDSVINYDIIPSVIYGMPEIAEVGINEDRAKAEGLDVTIKKLPFLYSGRFVVEVSKYNKEMVKVIINNKTNEIIGVTLYGKYASEIIGAAAILIKDKYTKEKLKKLVFPHPTVLEVMKDAAVHE